MAEAKKVPDLTPPVKGATKATATKAAATKTPAAPKDPNAPAKAPSAGAGAPRPRKHEYGIKPDAIVETVPETAEAAKRAGVAAAYEYAKAVDGKSPTVEQFYAKGGNRHDLRVMSRRGLIKIKWATGEVFPQDAVPKAPEAPKASDAAAPEAPTPTA